MSMIFIQGEAIMVNNDAVNGFQWVDGSSWIIKAVITAPSPDSSDERSCVFVG